MGLLISTYATLLLASFLLLHRLTAYLRRRRLNPPPGPTPWPVIGNLNLMGSLPHRSLHTLSKRYGPVMRIWFGSKPVLVASSVEAAKLILKTHDLSFSSRPKTAAGKYTTHNYSNITWSPYGPYWRQARRMCLMELFSSKRLESYRYIRVEESHRMLRELFELAKLAGEPVMIKEHLSSLSLNVISRMVLGKTWYLDDQSNNYEDIKGYSKVICSPDEFKKILDELFLLNGVLNIGDWIPYLGFMDLQGYEKRMKVLAKKLNAFLDHVLDEHEARRRRRRIADHQEWIPKDMVDVLLQLADDPNLEVKLERRGVKAFTQDLIAGGTESSAVTVEWAISELLKHPNLITKATEELDLVIGTERWVEEDDIPNLPYIRAIVKETMRLHPVAPMLVPRLSREDVNILGYDVVQDTVVLVNTWTIQRDPTVYENPEQFIPERFIKGLGPHVNVDVKGQDFELLPFGSGRRICPGYSLGLKVIESSLANLLHGFKWNLHQITRSEDLNMDEIFGLSNPRKIPLSVVIEPRLPSHLYYHAANSPFC